MRRLLIMDDKESLKKAIYANLKGGANGIIHIRKDDVPLLKKLLKIAIKKEDYLLCAKLRDKINAISKSGY